jgi:Ca2+-dependent lipid-binding protein
MASSIETRRVKLTARAAIDLTSAALVGTNTPYLEITLGDTTVTTTPDLNKTENPVWDESYEIELPGARPGENETILSVVCKNKVDIPMMKDTTIGRGSAPLAQLFGTGKEEARIPLHDSSGSPAGVAFIGVEMVQPEEHQEIPSSVGTVLGEVSRGPKGLAAEGAAGPTIVPTVDVTKPGTPLAGAVVPGNVDDPSSPAYGILRE